ncbi:MAG: hypothetical protein GC183_11620 [Thiobacillus sp.]|nr:hypothetical protein [Thiobacillus sp.]
MDIRDPLHAWSTICALVGHEIAAIATIYTVLTDEDNQHALVGLQIMFARGDSLRLESDPAEQDLRAANKAWTAALGETPTDRFLLDVSGQERFSDLIGQTIQATYPIKTTNNWLSGARFEIGSNVLNFVIDWDECYVFWGDGSEFEIMLGTVDYEQGCKTGDEYPP